MPSPNVSLGERDESEPRAENAATSDDDLDAAHCALAARLAGGNVRIPRRLSRAPPERAG